jgi:hypothetical protein
MATMTISEAEHIIDILAAALQKKQPPNNGENEKGHFWNLYHNHSPLSALQGYRLPQFNAALKLRIANMFLFLTGRNDFEERFTAEIRMCMLPTAPLALFIPDDLIAKLKQLAELSKILQRTSPEFRKHELPVMREINAFEESYWEFSYETSESFGDYCRSIGVEDPIYWQKIYTRLGLEYTSSSPRGNDPAAIE